MHPHKKKRLTGVAATIATVTLFVSAGVRSDTYVYDALGRLTYKETNSGGTKSRAYSYDAAGNRVSVVSSTGNQPPVGNDDFVLFNMYTGMALIYPLDNDTDPNSYDTLSILNFTQPAFGMVGLDQNTTTLGYFCLIAPQCYYGDTFQYTVSDGRGGTDTATVEVFAY